MSQFWFLKLKWYVHLSTVYIDRIFETIVGVANIQDGNAWSRELKLTGCIPG